MIYRSNLTAPDLRPYFRLLDPPRQHCGYDAPSDPEFDPACTYWTGDEAAILYNVAKSVPPGTWVDIGARLGWTAAHVAEAGHFVYAVDPELKGVGFAQRFIENTRGRRIVGAGETREGFMLRAGRGSTCVYDGFVIDGCHDSPEPLNDAMGAHAHAKPDCVILFHDFLGPAIRDGVRWLMDNGWRCRVYWTPNGVACCWRGHAPAHRYVSFAGRCETCGAEAIDAVHGFLPPCHRPDPAMDFRPHKAAMVDFQEYWERCE